MDGPTAQAKIWKGYSKAATKIGLSYQFYRPASGATPTVWTTGGTLNNPVFAQNIALNAQDMKFTKPQKYGNAVWYALTDGTNLEAGDYFVGEQGTFFIPGLQSLLPILAVACNHTVSLYRVAPQASPGAGSYSGITATTEVAYLTGAPCSILQGTKGEKNDANLPGDVRSPWWVILLPATAGTVQYGDLVIDEKGTRYAISSAELTGLGYRLTASLSVA